VAWKKGCGIFIYELYTMEMCLWPDGGDKELGLSEGSKASPLRSSHKIKMKPKALGSLETVT
jgi:hypothetical protein